MIDLPDFKIIIDFVFGKIIEEWIAQQGFKMVAISLENWCLKIILHIKEFYY